MYSLPTILHHATTKQYDKRLAEKKEQLKGNVSMESGALVAASAASAAAGSSEGEGGGGEETAPAASSPSSGQRQQRMRKV